MTERFLVLLQYVLPKRALTVLMGRLAAARAGWLTHAVVRWFVRRYRVEMGEAAQPDLETYPSFNEFFTRALRDGVRPIAHARWICPVDGAISQLGRIDGDRILQAKGHRYSARELVGGDAALAATFQDGEFATLYLSPKDYHRIHMPCAARLRRMIHVPGTLFSVNPVTVGAIPGVFARNERVVCLFESAHGPFVMALVGATVVGSIATTWHGVVSPPRPGSLREWRYDDAPVLLGQGDEMGRFLVGSTVVMLFPAGAVRFDQGWVPGRAIRMGEAMARACARRDAGPGSARGRGK